MVIKTIGLDECISKIRHIKGISIYKPIKDSTLQVQQIAKDLAPVKTGHLRRNILTEVTGEGYDVVGKVYNAVEYAMYQEFGTSRMAGNPFLRPAVIVARKSIQERMKKYLKGELDKFRK
jgi:HK97 gp10 family phage protein